MPLNHSTHPVEQIIGWGRSIPLQESAEVVTVLPMVTATSGGFLVSDLSEAQIRHYDRQGRLLRYLGHKGRGPGEFQAPIRAIRPTGDSLLVAEVSGLVHIYDEPAEQAGEPARSLRLPLQPIYDVRPLRDGRVVIAARGMEEGDRKNLLHLWEVGSDEVTSFFASPLTDRQHGGAAIFGGHVALDVRRDTIVAAFGFTDTLYVFGTDGRELRRVPIPSRNWRDLPDREPRSREDARRLLNESVLVRDVWWWGDRGFLVQLHHFDGKHSTFALLGMTRNGEPVFELGDTPRLLTVDSQGDELIFVDPDAEVPNRWSFASLQP